MLAVAVTLRCDCCIAVHTVAVPSMPALPSSIPSARSTLSMPLPRSTLTPEGAKFHSQGFVPQYQQHRLQRLDGLRRAR
jgi:hypothetical protein